MQTPFPFPWEVMHEAPGASFCSRPVRVLDHDREGPFCAAAPRDRSSAAGVLLPRLRRARKEEGQPPEPGPGLPGIVSPFVGEVAVLLFSSVPNFAEG